MLSEPLIPYLTFSELTLVPAHVWRGLPPAALSIKPFGLLVATGVLLASRLTLRRARRIQLDQATMTSFILWVVGIGFIGGHVFDVLFYYPQRLLDDPWSLLRLWDGLSSFGGFTGALLGMLAWRWWYAVPVLPYADNVMALLPVGWFFGRAGCSVAHDHPGLLSDSWIAVRYPGGARFDLGLLEMLLTVPLLLTFLGLGRRARPWGFFAALACVCYAPTRFALDFLRERSALPGDVHGAIDPRYGHFTPAQWECFLMLALGLVLLRRVLAALEAGEGFEPAQIPTAFRSAVATPSNAKT